MIKSKIKYKFFFLSNIFFIFFLIFTNSNVNSLESVNNHIILGEDSAPVKIKVFSSFTCPHCANFHIKVVTEIKKQYINQGKVQLIFIDFPLDEAALNASKLLHCLSPEKQIKFMDTIYEKQSSWVAGSDINEINNNLKKLVKDFNIDTNKFKQCLVNKKNEDNMLSSRIESQKKYSISSTPTVVINEKKLDNSINFENIKKKIDKLI